jgi:HPt (histidine-containing phosphotransfer) domain-containing protein
VLDDHALLLDRQRGPLDLRRLVDSIRIGDTCSASQWSHRLKSAAGMVSADALATLAAATEEASRIGDYAAASDTSAALQREAARVLEYLPVARLRLTGE